MPLEFIPLLIVVIGLLYAYLGIVIHYFFFMLTGFLVGGIFGFGIGVTTTESIIGGIIGFVLVGVIGAILFVIFQAVIVLALGYVIGHGIGILLGFDQIVSLFIGIMGAFLAWRVFIFLLIVGTAAFGSFLVAAGGTALNILGNIGNVTLTSIAHLFTPLMLIIFTTGIIVQTWAFLTGWVEDKNEDGIDITKGEGFRLLVKKNSQKLAGTILVIAAFLLGGWLGMWFSGDSTGIFAGLLLGIPAWLYPYYREGKQEAFQGRSSSLQTATESSIASASPISYWDEPTSYIMEYEGKITEFDTSQVRTDRPHIEYGGTRKVTQSGSYYIQQYSTASRFDEFERCGDDWHRESGQPSEEVPDIVPSHPEHELEKSTTMVDQQEATVWGFTTENDGLVTESSYYVNEFGYPIRIQQTFSGVFEGETTTRITSINEDVELNECEED